LSAAIPLSTLVKAVDAMRQINALPYGRPVPAPLRIDLLSAYGLLRAHVEVVLEQTPVEASK
jgi:hypothetical protein